MSSSNYLKGFLNVLGIIASVVAIGFLAYSIYSTVTIGIPILYEYELLFLAFYATLAAYLLIPTEVELLSDHRVFVRIGAIAIGIVLAVPALSFLVQGSIDVFLIAITPSIASIIDATSHLRRRVVIA